MHRFYNLDLFQVFMLASSFFSAGCFPVQLSCLLCFNKLMFAPPPFWKSEKQLHNVQLACWIHCMHTKCLHSTVVVKTHIVFSRGWEMCNDVSVLVMCSHRPLATLSLKPSMKFCRLPEGMSHQSAFQSAQICTCIRLYILQFCTMCLVVGLRCLHPGCRSR